MGDPRNSYTIPTNTFFPYVIPGATPDSAGVMTAEQAALLESLATGTPIAIYTNAARPAANAVGAVVGTTAVMIWNSTDHQPNFSDGVNWYDAAGNLT